MDSWHCSICSYFYVLTVLKNKIGNLKNNVDCYSTLLGLINDQEFSSLYWRLPAVLNLTSPSSIINTSDSFLGCHNHKMISLMVLLCSSLTTEISQPSPAFVYRCFKKCWVLKEKLITGKDRGAVAIAAPSAGGVLPAEVCPNGIFLYGHMCECRRADWLDNVF